MLEDIKNQFQENIELHKACAEKITGDIVKAVELIIDCYNKGNKLLLCGNGGSAADAQHIAGELVGRFKKERRGLPAIALTTDASIMTAVANDYWYDLLFARQVEALGKPGDILILITTSGNSINLIRAAEKANFIGLKTIGFLGRDGGKLKDIVNLPIIVPGEDSARIQEVHILIAHIICDLIEKALVK